MKKFLLLLFTVCCLLSREQLWANTVIVKGYVKDSTGNAIANRTVKIFTNDSSQGCIFTRTVTTNPNGYYTDTVSCNTSIKNIFVKVENCNGVWIIRNPPVNASAIIEVNFIICRPEPVRPTGCKAFFTFTYKDSVAYFNSEASSAPAGDSIISRKWFYIDGKDTLKLEGNVVDTFIRYFKPGVYTVFLTIKTRKGCENTFAGNVKIPTAPDGSGIPPADSIKPFNCKLNVQFATARVSGKKVQFNSMQTIAQNGDSIIKRKWKFGDGSVLEGNEISPVKEYKLAGTYNVCLVVKTKKGCEASICRNITVQEDSTNTQESASHFIKIISLNPNPVTTRMLVTIYSRNTQTEAEITVYDMYGAGKFSFKKILSQGNNIIEIGTAGLHRGPYFLKVTSRGSRDTKAFYKL